MPDGLLYKQKVAIQSCTTVLSIKGFGRSRFLLGAGGLCLPLPQHPGEHPRLSALPCHELLSRAEASGQLQGEQTKHTVFQGRARMYRQNVAILRLFNKDTQPEQKVSISLSL
jgi:hypothetical protein